MLRVLLLLLSLSSLTTGCSCDPPPSDPPPDDAVGSIDVVVDGAAATLSLAGLDAPLRVLQVDVAVVDGKATSVSGVGPWDVVEAGLVPSSANPDGGPRDRFTLVVADTRRLPVNDGALARLVVDAGSKVTLSKAFAIDANGKKRTITVVAR